MRIRLASDFSPALLSPGNQRFIPSKFSVWPRNLYPGKLQIKWESRLLPLMGTSFWLANGCIGLCMACFFFRVLTSPFQRNLLCHPSKVGITSTKTFFILLTCFIFLTAFAIAKSLQSCPTLCDPIDGSPPGPAVPGILQARTLEWVAVSSSNAWKWKVKVKALSRVPLLATPQTAAYQAPPFMGFSRQEYWSGMPLPSPSQHLALVNLYFSFLNLLVFHLYPQDYKPFES